MWIWGINIYILHKKQVRQNQLKRDRRDKIGNRILTKKKDEPPEYETEWLSNQCGMPIMEGTLESAENELRFASEKEPQDGPICTPQNGRLLFDNRDWRIRLFNWSVLSSKCDSPWACLAIFIGRYTRGFVGPSLFLAQPFLAEHTHTLHFYSQTPTYSELS